MRKRSQCKVVSKEVLALRKMRELRGVSRREAALKMGVSSSLIEQIENGRVNLSKERIVQFRFIYEFSEKEFYNICEGKVARIKKEICSKGVKVIENNKVRRSYKKVITKEVKSLIVLRKLKGLSQDKASSLCGYPRSSIGHIENGRVELCEKRIKHIVESYSYKMSDFHYHMKSEQFVTDIQDECIFIIKKLSEEKLKAVYPLLKTFQK